MDNSKGLKSDKVSEISIELPHYTLRGFVWNKESSAEVPLIFLHGWLDNAASFLPLGELLSTSFPGRKMVAFDWSGHGQSEHRAKGNRYHFIEWVEELVSAVNALGLSRVDVIAHSMGAGAAILAAGIFPEIFGKVVLIDGVGPLSNPAEDFAAQMNTSIKHRLEKQRVRRKSFQSLEALVEKRMGGMPVTKESATLLVERGFKRTNDGYEFSFDPELKAPSLMRLSEPQVSAALEAVVSDVLVILATQSFVVNHDLTQTRLEKLQSHTVKTVEAGHHVHLDAPEKIVGMIEDFLG